VTDTAFPEWTSGNVIDAETDWNTTLKAIIDEIKDSLGRISGSGLYPIKSAKYNIFKIDSIYYAVSGLSGNIGTIDSSDEADKVIQPAWDEGGIIVIWDGQFVVGDSLIPRSDVITIGMGWGSGAGDGTEIKLPNNANYPLLDLEENVNHFKLVDLCLHGNGDNGATGYLVDFETYLMNQFYCYNTRFMNGGSDNLRLGSGEVQVFYGCISNYSKRYGVHKSGGGRVGWVEGYIGNNTSHGVVLASTKYNSFRHVEIASNAGYGVYGNVDSHNTIFDCGIFWNDYHGILLDRSVDDKILWNDFVENSVNAAENSGCMVNGTDATNSERIKFIGNRGWDNKSDGREEQRQSYLLQVGEYTEDFTIMFNDPTGNLQAVGMLIAGSGHKTKWNELYITENNGSSIGTGSVQTIAHGLVSTPNKAVITPTASGATVSGLYVDDTNIYMTVTSGKTFNWEAEV